MATDRVESSPGNHFSSTPFSPGALVSVIALHGALLGLLIHAPVSTAKLEMPKPLLVTLLPAEAKPEAPVQAELLLLQPTPQVPVKPSPEMEPEIKPIVELESIPEPNPEIKPEPEPEPKPKQKPKKVMKRAPKAAVKLAEEKPPMPIEPPAQPIAPAEPEPAELAVAAPRRAPEPSPAAEPVYNPPRFLAAYLSNPPPAYPRLSRRMGEQGRVLLRVLVSDDGLSKKVEIESSSGSSRLDQAASEAVATWRFVPAKRGEQAIAAWVVVPIVFSLEG